MRSATTTFALPSRSRPAASKEWIHDWAPPGCIRLVQRALDFVRPARWEYVSDGWRTGAPLRGWNVASVAEAQKGKWRAYVESLQGTAPLGINHENLRQPITGDLRDHNTLISYAYVLALAARQKERVTLLDWGGGMGHYYPLSQAVLPDVEIDYTCHDVPLLCQIGREALPQAHFFETPEECFSRHYDLVLASSSVWYEEDWRALLEKLAIAADPYLYITRMMFVERARSYVAIQRPSAVGYRTEYLCWILNRDVFVSFVGRLGMELLREFLICKGAQIRRAPEQGDYRGFLFRKRDAAKNQSTKSTSK